MAEFEVYRVRFKCADGIQFEFDCPPDKPLAEVRSSASFFRDVGLPDVFKPCSFDVRISVSDIDPADIHFNFIILAYQALCRSLRFPYLFNSKFYRYALKSKEKRASKA